MGRRGNHEGTYKKLENGRWRARVRINGERLSFNGQTRADVQKQVTEARHRAEAGRLPADRKRTVGAFLDEWLEHCRPAIANTTAENYELNVTRVRPFLGEIKLTELRAPAIQEAYAKLREGKTPSRRPLSEQAIHQVHRTLRAALHHAVRAGYIVASPMDLVSTPRPERRETTILTPEQAERLFDVSRGHDLYPLWILLVNTGLRIGEALALRWRNIDLDEGVVSIRRKVHYEKGMGLVEGPTKTAGSRRDLDLTPRTIRVLKVKQAEARLAAGPDWSDELLVFSTAEGRPLDGGYVHRRLQYFLGAADLPRVRVHDLRHTYATLAFQQGVTIGGVQKSLGHASATTTLNVYAHVTRDMQKEAARAMDRLFPDERGAV